MGMVRVALAAAVFALATRGVVGNHLGDDSQIVTEHGRIQLLKSIAQLAIDNLNTNDGGADAFKLGRLIEVTSDSAVNHRYKSIIPRGLTIKLHYEAVKETAKQTAVCTAEVSLSLESTFTVDTNTCEFTVKAGNGANVKELVEDGVKQELGLASVHSAAGTVGSLIYNDGRMGDATTVYVCTARSLPGEGGAGAPGTTFHVQVSLTPDCAETEYGEVFKNPVNEFLIQISEPPEVDIDASLKGIIAFMTLVIWVLLYVYHIRLFKKDIKNKISERAANVVKEANKAQKAAAKEAKKEAAENAAREAGE